MKRPNWDHVKEEIEKADAEASIYVALKEDGAKVIGVFLGDPYTRRVHWDGSKYVECTGDEPAGVKPKLRIAMNFAVRTDNGWEVKVIENTKAFFVDVMKVDSKYGLTDWAFEVERHGAANNPKTHYTVLPEDKLTEDDTKAIAGLELINLKGLFTENSDNTTQKQFGEYDQETIPDDVAEAMIVVLKNLPDECTSQFLDTLKIKRIRDLALKDKQSAVDLLDKMEADVMGVPNKADPLA